ININKAGIKVLSMLPGIGPAYAQNIIEYRNTKGFFTTKKELLNVRGIGDARFAKIESLITLGEVDSITQNSNPSRKAPTQEAKQPHSTKYINVNTANIAGLSNLPGIGPAYAQNIITYRNKNGSFTAKDELLQ